MSVFLQRDPLSILLGLGGAAGLTFGLGLGVLLGFTMRPGTTRIPIGEVSQSLSRFDSEFGRMRYRLLRQDGDTRTYAPRELVRTGLLDIEVRTCAGTATLTGPRASLLAVEKRLRQEGSL
jgi:hypothetical protein